MSLTRLEAFSDGVFSIAATLLVLEFKVPDLHGASPANVTASLVHLGGPLLAYVTSFVVIGVVWVNHHPLFKGLDNVNRTTVVLNLVLLLVVAFLPFPTELIADYGNIPQVVMFYGLAQAATGIAFNVLAAYVGHTYRTKESAALSARTRNISRAWSYAYPCAGLAGAALAFINTRLSIVIFIVLPLAYLLPNAAEWMLTRDRTEAS
jgi:uncharacterized membrane protein